MQFLNTHRLRKTTTSFRQLFSADVNLQNAKLGSPGVGATQAEHHLSDMGQQKQLGPENPRKSTETTKNIQQLKCSLLLGITF
jgi:hypothetical protein